MPVIWCKWLPKDDDEAIEEYTRNGWEIMIVDGHHGNFSVLATREENDKQVTYNNQQS